jgi:DNA-binding response OmpR family regulator
MLSKGPMTSADATILVVEDNPGLRSLAEEVLSSAGYSILTAPDGFHALRVAQEYSGQIQLLLTDLALPEMTGQEIATRLQALRPETKVLFMSGHARGTVTENGTLDPEANFIEKPWSPRELCAEVHALLTAQPSMRTLVADDDAGICDWLTEVLEANGHQVFTVKDGLEAKRLATRQALDLVITDISMPNEEGLGIIRALRKAHPGLKIIAISGGNAEALMDAKLLGAAATLAKPFTSAMLLKCIRGLSPIHASGAAAEQPADKRA